MNAIKGVGTVEAGARRNRRGRSGRSGRIRLAAAVLLVGVLLTGALPEQVWAATHSFKSTTIYADGTRTAKFTCNGMTGLCCDAGAYSTYSGTASLSRMSNTANAARCAYYYGYKKGWTSGSNAHKLSRLLSYCMGNGTNGDFKTSTMKSLLATAKKEAVPDGFECWLCKPKGSSKQNFIVWQYPKGRLKVLKKSANTGISGSGNYNLAGITIKVFSDAACTKCVKTLTTKKDGTTGGAFSMHVGTYYVKETNVPEGTGFLLNPNVYKAKVTAGSKVVTVTAVNTPDTGSLTIRKVVTGNGGTVSDFRFILTSQSTGKTYTLVTGADGTAKVSGLPFGTYTLKEEMTAEQQKLYTDRTGLQTITLAKGAASQHLVVQRDNLYEPRQQLKIIKKTEDDGSPAGFHFLVTWKLADSKTITAEELVKAADPQIQLEEGQSAGIWQIKDPAQIEAINAAARRGEPGRFEIALCNTVTTVPKEEEADEPEGETTGGSGGDANAETDAASGSDANAGTDAASGSDANAGADAGGDSEETTPVGITERVEVTVRVELTGIRETDLSQTGQASGSITAAEPAETETGSYRVLCSDIEFQGAATTGEQTVVTDSSGQYVAEQIRPGVYTVREQMTDRQKKRYRQPDPQEVTIEEGTEGTVAIVLENQPIRVPVRLKKSSADGKISDIEFTLSGTPAYAEALMDDLVVRTGEDGIADFGLLYPGSYVIEETGFNETTYANSYRMEGKEKPAFAFEITGEELTDEQIEGGACLWLGGDPQKGGVSADSTTFRNTPYVDLYLTKVDGVTHGFLPGAEFALRDEEDALAAQFRIDADEDGMAVPVMLQSGGIVTAETADDTEGNSQVILGGDVPQETAYPCIVLHGLVEGRKYTLTETAAPEGFAPLQKPYVFTVTLDEKGEPVLNTCDEYGESIEASTNRGTLVVVNEAPSIGTVALDELTGDHIADAAGQVTLVDTCRVTNLAEGRTYTLIARLMDTTEYKRSGKDGDVTQVRVNGEPIVGVATFEADARAHTVRVPIRLNASALAGTSTVIYESLYTGTVDAAAADQVEAVSEEADPDSEAQKVVFPKIGTTASLNGGNKIRDRVRYQDLLPGKTYCMQGLLVNKATGEEIEGSLQEKRFRAEAGGSGKVTMTFHVDTSALAEQEITELVVFEKCYLVEKQEKEDVLRKVASHEDINDMDQTVRLDGIPKTGDRFPGIAAGVLMAAVCAGIVVWRRRRYV